MLPSVIELTGRKKHTQVFYDAKEKLRMMLFVQSSKARGLDSANLALSLVWRGRGEENGHGKAMEKFSRERKPEEAAIRRL